MKLKLIIQLYLSISIQFIMEFNAVYHVFNHANGREQLFYSYYSYNLFMQKFEEYILPVAEVYAYCLMPNHFHILLRIRPEEEVATALKVWTETKVQKRAKRLRRKTLDNKKTMSSKEFVSKSFSNFFNSYTRTSNLVFNRYGSMFIKNFKRKIVDEPSYFARVLFYIHHNPVNHRFCTAMEKWNWSSYNAYYKKRKSFVSKDYPISFFGGLKPLIDHHKELAEASKKVEDPLDYLPSEYAFKKKF
ncbi:MAG: transposase [Chitinophagaceae bacterium]